jgi:hypothetical protein
MVKRPRDLTKKMWNPPSKKEKGEESPHALAQGTRRHATTSTLPSCKELKRDIVITLRI